MGMGYRGYDKGRTALPLPDIAERRRSERDRELQCGLQILLEALPWVFHRTEL